MHLSLKPQYLILAALLISCSLLLSDCEEEKPQIREYPRLKSLPVKNITEEGAIFSADLYSLGTEEIEDYGFVWGTNEYLDYRSSNRKHIETPATEGIFSAEIKTTFQDGIEYTVKAFVKTSERVIYGSSVKFKSLGSLGPFITGFEPDSAAWGDTLKITGINFSWVGAQNIVSLGGVQCSIVSATDTSLLVTVPYSLNLPENSLTIELAGNIASFDQKKFRFIPPVLDEFYPARARWGDTVTIKGRRLKSLTGSQFIVKLGIVNCTTVGILTDSTLKIIVPNNFNSLTGNFTLVTNNMVLSNLKAFTLMPPVIESFSPQKGLRNCLVTLFGKFNPDFSKCVVELNNTLAPIVSCTKDSIQIRIPMVYNVTTAAIVYKSAPFEISPATSFNIVYPKINQLNPASARFGESIEILGENLTSTAGKTQVEFGYGFVATIKSLSENLIVANVPSSIDSIPRKIQITVGIDIVHSDVNFVLAPHEIISVEGSPLIPGGELSIIGSGFSTNLTSLQAYLDENKMNIKSASNSEIRAIIPKSVPRNPSRISVISGGYKRSSDVTFKFNSQWLKILVPSSIRYYSSSDRNSGIGFAINNKGYLIMPWGSMASFDPISRSFTNMGEQSILNGSARGISGVVQQDTFYLIIPGWRLITYRFNSSNNSWTALKAPPNALYGNGTAFSIDNKLYYGLGCDQYGRLVDGSVYQYNSKNDSWSYKSSFPWIASRYVITSFTINEKAYLLFGDRFFCEYDPVTNIWTAKASYPVSTSRYDVVSFILNNKPYVGAGKELGASIFYDEFYNYDPESNTWIKAQYAANDGTKYDMLMPGGIRARPLNFVINNLLYIGFGYRYNFSYNDFYEFDPNYPLK